MQGIPVPQHIAQVAAILLIWPLLHGFIVTVEEKIQRGQVSSVLQPCRDLWKLLRKEIVVPQSASWVFWAAPVVVFAAMLTVLTNYPLPLSDMGDILGGGLILALDGFAVLLAGLDSDHPDGDLGSSSEAMLVVLAEPTLIMAFIGITRLVLSIALLRSSAGSSGGWRHASQ